MIKTIRRYGVNEQLFTSRKDRELDLARFVYFYNTVKPHVGIGNMTPEKN